MKIAQYWDWRAPSFDKDHDTEDKDAWKSTLIRLLGENRNKNVLDIGTGSGFIANMTSALGYPTVGVDISLEMMKNGVRHAESEGVGTFFMEVPEVKLPFMDTSIDNIVNCRLIWTMVAADDMVREWMRILRPGGSVFSFNRLDAVEGLKRPDGGRFDYGDEEVNEALDNEGRSTAELIDLFTRNGYVHARAEHLPGLTLPGFDYQDWYVIIAEKPTSARHDAAIGMAEYWDNAAHRYDQGHMIANIPAWHTVLEGFVGPDKDAVVLDVATGTGIIACTLGEAGYTNITGIDLSELMMRVAIDRAREKGLDIPFIYGNAMELPYPDESVDVVISCRLLWTLAEPQAALAEWLRVLKPGGRIVAINEFEGDAIECRGMDEYCATTRSESFAWSNASKAQLVADATAAGFVDAAIHDMPGCHLANSDRENWNALVALKPQAV